MVESRLGAPIVATGPQTIEIVGVAGSGKSTLARVLRARHGCHVADSLHTRLPAHWPYVAHSLPRVLRVVAASVRERPLPSWDELKFVAYVAEWDRFLRAEHRNGAGTIVLDQGPMFAIARLLWGGKPITRHPSFEMWLQRMVEHWSRELDAIVLLDAPDDVLLARIDVREQGHDAKGAPVLEGLELIRRHRQAYARVLELIESAASTRMLRYDTASMPPARIAGELAGIFELSRVQELTETPRAPNLIHGSAPSREDA